MDRVIYNLGILLVLTAAVDWITWGRLVSVAQFVTTMFGRRYVPHSPTPL
ncbi:MAG: hypothetical protein JO211_14970 [Acidobacteriaceae bacterium]|nr:hypothetical protein [Acidobacteriaceae bacterium]